MQRDYGRALGYVPAHQNRPCRSQRKIPVEGIDLTPAPHWRLTGFVSTRLPALGDKRSNCICQLHGPPRPAIGQHNIKPGRTALKCFDRQRGMHDAVA